MEDVAARALVAMKKKSGVSSKKSIKRTSGDNKLDACVNIKTTIGVLGMARNVLLDLKDTSNEEKINAKRRREANDHYEMLDLALAQSANTLKIACKHVNPLPDSSVDYAIKRLKNIERSTYAVNKPSSPADEIKEFIANTADDDDDSPSPSLGRNRNNEPRRSTRNLPTMQQSFPAPINGYMYSRVEFLRIHSGLTTRKQRGQLINACLKNKWVPLTTKGGIYYAINHFKSSGKTLDEHDDFPWNSGSGQKPLLAPKDYTILTNKLDERMGKKAVKKRLKNTLQPRERVMTRREEW